MNRKIIRNTIKLVNSISPSLHDYIVRLMFKADPPVGILKDVVYKIAETHDEVDQAFRLIQKSYVETDLSAKRHEKYNLNKFKILPSTTIFIAKYKDLVIASASQVMDTSLGLPIEEFESVDELRAQGKRISEITGLAIHPEWRSQSQGVFFPLICYCVMYSHKHIGTENFVIVTRSSAKNFYRAIFSYKPLSKKDKMHTGVNKLSFAQWVNYDELVADIKRFYKNRSLFKNPYKMTQVSFPWKDQCDFEPPKYAVLFNRSFNLKTMEYFFKLKTDIIENLPSKDLEFLKNLYEHQSYQDLLGENIHLNFKRDNPRFYTNMSLTYKKDKQDIEQKVIEISKSGFSVYGNDFEDLLEGHLHLSESTSCYFKAQLMWKAGHKAGYKLTHVDDAKWDKLFLWIDEQTKFYLEIPEEEQKDQAA